MLRSGQQLELAGSAPAFLWDEIVWEELALAFCLLLIIEGLLPFLYPGRWRRLVQRLATVDDRSLRTAGLVCMLAGLFLLYLLR